MNNIIVLYCYYEKNQNYKTNLEIFLKYGIYDECDYLFIVNGHSSIDIPKANNINVLIRDNKDYDFGAYHNGLQLLNINHYKYFIFLNTSVRGPFIPSYIDMKWYIPYLRLIKDDVKLVGSTINILNTNTDIATVFEKTTNFIKPYSHVQTQIFAMDKECLDFLIEKKLFDNNNYQSYVEFIAIKEILMSQLVLKNGWNISCLIKEYQNLDYRTIKYDINSSSNNGDPNFNNACFQRTIHPYESIFIKINRDMNFPLIQSLTKTLLIQKVNKLDVIIYVLYHDDVTYKTALELSELPWVKLKKIYTTKYFENVIFLMLDENKHEWINKKFVGFLTYSSTTKLQVYDIQELARLYSNFDVMSFNNYNLYSMLEHSEIIHPSFTSIWTLLLQKLGFDNDKIVSNDIPVYFNNYWMAKPEWLEKYIIFFKKVIFILENDEDIKLLINNDSNYKGKLLDNPNLLLKIMGKPYYTFHPFILERLVCFFFWHENAKLYKVNHIKDPVLDKYKNNPEPLIS